MSTTTAKAIGTLVPIYGEQTTCRKPFEVRTVNLLGMSLTGEDVKGNSYSVLMKYWRFVPVDEARAAWDGEGLPPVGSFVEACSIEEVDRCDLNFDEHCIVDTWKSGEELEVIAHKTVHGVDCVIVFNVKKMQASAIMADYYRPIRTPEQIAAEEREQACAEMYDLLREKNPMSLKQASEILVEAGYHKQVAP